MGRSALKMGLVGAAGLVAAVMVGGCAKSSSTLEVRDYLVGSYDSAAQAKADPDYRVIVLHMAACWTDRKDGPWVYVEQAVAEMQQAPYRQRVYRLVDLGKGQVRSDVYELPGTPAEVVKNFAGQWKNEKPLSGISPEQLTLKDGCSITLTRQADGAYVGATGVGTCASSLRGAAYATSEVVLTREVLRSWDRGYDKDGKQVWGAEKGGYVFVKKVEEGKK